MNATDNEFILKDFEAIEIDLYLLELPEIDLSPLPDFSLMGTLSNDLKLSEPDLTLTKLDFEIEEIDIEILPIELESYELNTEKISLWFRTIP